MFLKLRRHEQMIVGRKVNVPLVSQDSSIVDENGDSPKSVNGTLDDGCSVGDRGGVRDGLAAS